MLNICPFDSASRPIKTALRSFCSAKRFADWRNMQYFNSLPQVSSLDKAELIRRTNIERSYGYQILKGTRSPGRDKVLLLCICAVLNLHETQRALRCAGEPELYSRSRRDAIIIFALNERLNIADTQELLMQFDEPVLE